MAKLKVIYRDSSFLAVHKPSGIATYRESRGQAPGGGSGTEGCKELLEEQLNQRLFPVHRIDADTSGVVLFALDSKAASGFIRLFKEQRINKTYLAWCVGELPKQGSIRTPLKKHKSELTESARTDYECVKTKGGFSQVRIFPWTGRFHQIRRHFDTLGHPVVGDPLYGNEASWQKFFSANQKPRLMLLAESVEFAHPITRKNLFIKTKEDF